MKLISIDSIEFDIDNGSTADILKAFFDVSVWKTLVQIVAMTILYNSNKRHEVAAYQSWYLPCPIASELPREMDQLPAIKSALSSVQLSKVQSFVWQTPKKITKRMQNVKNSWKLQHKLKWKTHKSQTELISLIDNDEPFANSFSFD